MHPRQAEAARSERQVAIVDPDEVACAGYAAVLSGHPQVGAVIGLSHDEALARPSWAETDVVLLEATDIRRRRDQVPGVAVVEAIRRTATARQPRIVVVSGLRPDDAVRLRLREAGADAYVQRYQVREAGRLRHAVLEAGLDDQIPPPVDSVLLQRLGITAETRVNRGVEAAFTERLVPEAGWIGPRGRDREARRARFNEVARLHPVGSDGRPVSGSDIPPSLAQIQWFVAWATQVDGWR